jgi:hypothetical protein
MKKKKPQKNQVLTQVEVHGIPSENPQNLNCPVKFAF